MRRSGSDPKVRDVDRTGERKSLGVSLRYCVGWGLYGVPLYCKVDGVVTQESRLLGPESLNQSSMEKVP